MKGLRRPFQDAVLAAVLCVIGRGEGGAAGDKVKVLVDDNLASIILFVGLEKGFFEKEGVTVEPVQSRMFSRAKIDALANGTLDVARMVYSTTLNEVMPKAGFRMTADGGVMVKGQRHMVCVLVRKDLAGRVKGWADLKGRPVGLPAPGAPIYMTVLRGLESAGLTIADLDVRPMPNAQLLASGAVDAGVFWEPLASHLVRQGVAEVFAGTDVADWSGQFTGLFYSKRFRGRVRAATAFMAAYLRGLEAYHALPPAELAAIASKYLPEKVGPEAFSLIRFSGDGAVDAASVMDLQREAVRRGLIKEPLDEARLFDFTFLDRARAGLRAKGPAGGQGG